MADFDAQSTNLDLNAATSAMFEDRKGHAMGSADIFGLPAATVRTRLDAQIRKIDPTRPRRPPSDAPPRRRRRR